MCSNTLRIRTRLPVSSLTKRPHLVTSQWRHRVGLAPTSLIRDVFSCASDCITRTACLHPTTNIAPIGRAPGGQQGGHVSRGFQAPFYTQKHTLQECQGIRIPSDRWSRYHGHRSCRCRPLRIGNNRTTYDKKETVYFSTAM